jgi:carbonic anhydrase
MRTSSPARATPSPWTSFVLPSLLVAAVAVPLAARASDAAHAHPAPKPAAATPAAAAHSPPAAAEAAPANPLDHLRDRLAERLSAGKVTAVNGPYDVRVVVKSTDTHATSSRHTTAARASASRKAAAAEPAHAGPVHWDYRGPAGPQGWGDLKPEFSLCANGQRQSPIDIRGGLAVDLDPVKFNYRASPFGVVDNGHTVQANVAPGNSIEIRGQRYELVQFHFHRPSEERIDGRQFEMSLHLVHKDEQDRLAVVTVLMEKGPPQPVVQQVWNNLPLERGDERPAAVPLELPDLLPTDRRYFTYMGSLTTPPCSEGVRWVVMRQPVTMAPEQIELFARIYPMNARPVQQAAGRRILQSQ